MKKNNLLRAFLVGAAAGLAGATLLLLQRQCARVERSLRDDFRVVLFMKAELGEGPGKVLEERLRALPSVEDVRAVSKRDALEALRREEPELVASLSFLSDNPLNPAFEVKLAPDALGGLPQWLEQAQALADWADIRYKAVEVEAILQAAVFSRFIGVALSALVCLTAFLALAGLWAGRGWAVNARVLSHMDAALCAAGGAAFGVLAASGLALPLRSAAPGWAWPSGWQHAAVLVCAATAGWVLCGLRD